jgi:hypothetical protein
MATDLGDQMDGQNEFSEVERELRGRRAPLDGQLEGQLASRVRPMNGGRGRMRAGMALIATTGVFAALAASGGVSYAMHSVKTSVGQSSTNNCSSHTQYGEGGCVEYVNPHGANIPPAGQTSPGTNPRSGQNPDGFYQIGAADHSMVYVIDTATGIKFGPYPSGTVIKYTESNGKTPSEMKIGSSNGQAGAVTVHIQGQGDAAVQSVLGGPLTVCYVPPKPK